MLGGNLGSLLYGDVSVMVSSVCILTYYNLVVSHFGFSDSGARCPGFEPHDRRIECP